MPCEPLRFSDLAGAQGGEEGGRGSEVRVFFASPCLTGRGRGLGEVDLNVSLNHSTMGLGSDEKNAEDRHDAAVSNTPPYDVESRKRSKKQP